MSKLSAVPTRAEHAAGMANYVREGGRLAKAIGNCGPVRRGAKIDARETPFRYRPFAGLEDQYRLTGETFERVIRDYNTRDLAI